MYKDNRSQHKQWQDNNLSWIAMLKIAAIPKSLGKTIGAVTVNDKMSLFVMEFLETIHDSLLSSDLVQNELMENFSTYNLHDLNKKKL